MFFSNWLVFQLEKVPADAQNRVVVHKFWRLLLYFGVDGGYIISEIPKAYKVYYTYSLKILCDLQTYNH